MTTTDNGREDLNVIPTHVQIVFAVSIACIFKKIIRNDIRITVMLKVIHMAVFIRSSRDSNSWCWR